MDALHLDEITLIEKAWVGNMAAEISVAQQYTGLGLLIFIGLGFPIAAFTLSRFFRPMPDPDDPSRTKSYFMDGYEVDHSNYPRRLSTYECGSDPIGDAMIQFHFQYYWYALIFLVFDIAFMFLAFGGISTVHNSKIGAPKEALGPLVTLSVFFFIMVLGVWHVFRKRGRIYI